MNHYQSSLKQQLITMNYNFAQKQKMLTFTDISYKECTLIKLHSLQQYNKFCAAGFQFNNAMLKAEVIL
jgi:hypothetical protein